MADFSNAPWSSPESNLSPDDFCAVSLIDLNPKGKEKVKGLCKLPVRSKPGGPVNINAVHACAGAHGIQGVDAPPDAKRAAARKLVGYYDDAGEQAPPAVYRMAGMKMPMSK